MDINLGIKDKIIRDADIKKKFEEFSNGFFDDISMELYETDGKYFLNLSPYTDKILSSNMCITARSKSELESIIEDLSCNIGVMLVEKSGKIQKNETNKQTAQINGKQVSILDFEQVHIEGKNGDIELYKADELTEKIKSISSKAFSSEKDFDMSSYVKNTMFTRMNGKYTLEKEDFELLKYYKEEGYEFLNSFLGNGELKTRGNIEKEHVGKEFIDNLYKIDELFEKFPTLDGSITVYRGATTKNSLNNVEYNSFVSTSLDRRVAENNFSKGRLYQINLPKGTHYIPMDAINGFEGMYEESEAEILLRPSSFNVMNKEMKGDTEVLSVDAKEKGNFSEIIRKSLESRKAELIKKGLCDEKEFKEVLDYLNEKHKEEMIRNAKTNESKYKVYRMDIMKKITETRSNLDKIRENMPDSEIEKAEKKLKELELVQEYNSLINSAKGYDLTLKDIKLLIQNLEGKIDKFERSKGLQELKQRREKLDKESEVIYSRDEVSKLESAIKVYKLQSNQERVDEFNIKLKSAQKQYEYAKKQLEIDKEHKKENIGQSGYSVEGSEKKVIENQKQVLIDDSGKEIGKRTMTNNGQTLEVKRENANNFEKTTRFLNGVEINSDKEFTDGSYDIKSRVFVADKGIKVSKDYINYTTYRQQYNAKTNTYLDRSQSPLIDENGNVIGEQESIELLCIEDGRRQVKTNSTIENENGIYDLETVYDGTVEKDILNIDNKLSENKEQIQYLNEDGKETYIYMENGVIGEKIIKTERGTTIDVYKDGKPYETYEYDENGKALIQMAGLEELPKDFVKNSYEMVLPEYEIVSHKEPEEIYEVEEINQEQEEKQEISTQKLGKETLDIQTDVEKIDIIEQQLTQHINEQSQTIENNYQINQFGEIIRTSDSEKSFRDDITPQVGNSNFRESIKVHPRTETDIAVDKVLSDFEKGITDKEEIKKKYSHKVEKGDNDYIR